MADDGEAARSNALALAPSRDALRPLLVHATLVALTPLVPVPFVDDALKDRVQRRLVRQLADTHRLVLTDAEVRTLADDPPRRWMRGIATSAAMMPVKFVLRKAFVVLQGTRIVDLASESFHRGYLLDRTFGQRWCAPAGAHSPRTVRAAIDAVCAEVPTKPVAHAFRLGFEQSRVALATAVDALRARANDAGSVRASDDAAVTPAAVAETVKRIQAAIAEAPEEHFRALDTALTARLAGRPPSA